MPEPVEESNVLLGWLQTLRAAVVDVLLAGTIVAGSIGGLWLTISHLMPAAASAWAVLLVLVTVWLGRILRKLPESRLDRLAIVLVGLGMLLRVGYVLVVDRPADNDFRNMWVFALRMTDALVQPQDLEQVRALPFLWPMALLGRGSALAYQLGNCAALAVASWLAYRLARRHLGAPAGVLGLVLATLTPELTLAAEIPSHDIPGTMFLVIALALLDQIDQHADGGRRAGRLFGLAVVLGIVLWLLDLQRGMAPFVLGAVLLVGIWNGSTRGWLPRVRRAVLMVAVPVATLALAGRALDSALAISTATLKERHRWFWMAAYANASSSGTNADLGRFWREFTRMSTDEVRAFAVARTATEYAERPAARAPNYLSRTAWLHVIGSQLFFYLPLAEHDGDATFPAIARVTRALAPPLSAGMRAFFLAALLLGTLRLMARGDGARFDLPLVTCALLVVALGLLGERQARYLLPYWVLLAPVAAVPFAGSVAWAVSWKAARRRVPPAVVAGGAFALVFVAGSVILNRVYDYEDGRILRVETGQIIGAGRMTGPHAVRIPPDSGEAGLRVPSGRNLSGVFSIIATVPKSTTECAAVLELRRPGGDSTQRLSAGVTKVLLIEMPVEAVIVRAAAPGVPRCLVDLLDPRFPPR